MSNTSGGDFRRRSIHLFESLFYSVNAALYTTHTHERVFERRKWGQTRDKMLEHLKKHGWVYLLQPLLERTGVDL